MIPLLAPIAVKILFVCRKGGQKDCSGKRENDLLTKTKPLAPNTSAICIIRPKLVFYRTLRFLHGIFLRQTRP